MTHSTTPLFNPDPYTLKELQVESEVHRLVLELLRDTSRGTLLERAVSIAKHLATNSNSDTLLETAQSLEPLVDMLQDTERYAVHQLAEMLTAHAHAKQLAELARQCQTIKNNAHELAEYADNIAKRAQHGATLAELSAHQPSNGTHQLEAQFSQQLASMLLAMSIFNSQVSDSITNTLEHLHAEMLANGTAPPGLL